MESDEKELSKKNNNKKKTAFPAIFDQFNGSLLNKSINFFPKLF